MAQTVGNQQAWLVGIGDQTSLEVVWDFPRQCPPYRLPKMRLTLAKRPRYANGHAGRVRTASSVTMTIIVIC
ncbi:MAG: hypothetical protein F6J90_19610 [Moorea sp. SIOASIH]|uniref:hypothetical protein n=1 Tax=Moorena sp. SIOASIH TaxID=2607817 RepID=UPI0013BC279D|nr:hypothetical protein [Moorena sp. SIOASIH]NEO38421.1 hypothetical protein [Moorena sp. SIOASIH]